MTKLRLLRWLRDTIGISKISAKCSFQNPMPFLHSGFAINLPDPRHVRIDHHAGKSKRPLPAGFPISSSSLLTKMLLQEGQHGPHHGLLTFIGVQASTGLTGEEFTNPVTSHKNKVGQTPMNRTTRGKEKQASGRGLEAKAHKYLSTHNVQGALHALSHLIFTTIQ